MDFLGKTDWGRMFAPEMSLPEIFVRGTLIYLALCLLLRVVLKRQAGKVSLSDLLVVALVAGVCRNPLVRDAYSVTDGLLVVATVLGWSYALDWLSYHVPLVHKLLHAPPVLLIRDGQVLKENLRAELMTASRLGCKLRLKGVSNPAEVAEAWMEGDGEVSVIKKSDPAPARRESPGQAPGQGGDGPAGPVRNGTPAGFLPSAEPEVRAFLEAARTLENRIERHRQAVAEHERGVAEIQQALARYGFRIKPGSRPRRGGKTRTLPGSADAPGSS